MGLAVGGILVVLGIIAALSTRSGRSTVTSRALPPPTDNALLTRESRAALADHAAIDRAARQATPAPAPVTQTPIPQTPPQQSRPAIEIVEPIAPPPPAQPRPIPEGYDPARARQLAPVLAADIRNYEGTEQYAENLRLLRGEILRFQRAAGLTPDGYYGGATRGALIHFGVPARITPRAITHVHSTYTPPESRS